MYHSFTGIPCTDVNYFEDLLYQCKKQIVEQTMESDMDALGRLLLNCAEESWLDFSYKQCKHAVREVICCFSVYRTFVSPGKQTKVTDKQCI